MLVHASVLAAHACVNERPRQAGAGASVSSARGGRRPECGETHAAPSIQNTLWAHHQNRTRILAMYLKFCSDDILSSVQRQRTPVLGPTAH
jgi:hypothetical protein